MKVKELIVFSYGTKASIALFFCAILGVHYYIRAKNIYDPKNKRWVRIERPSVDSNAYESSGLTPLMKAANKLDYNTLLSLLQKGADPNARSKDIAPRTNKEKGYTALHYAIIRAGRPQARFVIEALMANGANPNIKENIYGNAPLLMAPGNVADTKQCVAIALLHVRHGGNINIQNNAGNTVLHMAVENNSIKQWMEIARKHLQALFNLSLKNANGKTVYQYALDFGAIDADNEQDVALFTKKMVRPSVGQRSKMGYTGLMVAAVLGDRSYAQQQIAGGERVNAESSDKQKQTALHLACIHEHPELVALLVKHDAAVNKKDANGNTALHLTTMGHNLEKQKALFKQLIAKKASINAKNVQGNTPLQCAVVEQKEGLVDFMIATYGKQIAYGIKNNSYKTALDIAKELNYTDLVNALQTAVGY